MEHYDINIICPSDSIVLLFLILLIRPCAPDMGYTYKYYDQ